MPVCASTATTCRSGQGHSSGADFAPPNAVLYRVRGAFPARCHAGTPCGRSRLAATRRCGMAGQCTIFVAFATALLAASCGGGSSGGGANDPVRRLAMRTRTGLLHRLRRRGRVRDARCCLPGNGVHADGGLDGGTDGGAGITCGSNASQVKPAAWIATGREPAAPGPSVRGHCRLPDAGPDGGGDGSTGATCGTVTCGAAPRAVIRAKACASQRTAAPPAPRRVVCENSCRSANDCSPDRVVFPRRVRTHVRDGVLDRSAGASRARSALTERYASST